MKKLFAVFLLSNLLLAHSVFAETAILSVRGLVCAFCAQGIKKRFSAEEAVEKVDVSLEKMLVTLNFKKGLSLSDAAMKNHIKDVGYTLVKIERKP